MRDPFHCAGCGKPLSINGDHYREPEGNFCDAICRAFFRQKQDAATPRKPQVRKPFNPAQDQTYMMSMVFITLGLMSILNYFISTF